MLHSFKACFNVLTETKKYEPVACIVDGNVQLYVLYHMPDNFQGETKMVFDRQAAEIIKSRFVTDIYYAPYM